MKLREGRIGRQESVSVLCIGLYTSAIFTVDSVRAYATGNSSYVWLPMSILLSLGLFLVCCTAMRRAGCEGLGEMLSYAFGSAGSAAVICMLTLVLILDTFLPISYMITMIHSYIFPESSYALSMLWVIAAIAVIAFTGFESIGRVAKAIGVLLMALVLMNLLLSSENYRAYRLYPLMGDGMGNIAERMIESTFKTAPVLLAALSMTTGMQGLEMVKKASVISALITFAVCLLTQLAIGMTYTYSELAGIYFPLYRLNMPLLSEGYIYRVDKLILFIWLTAGIIASSFYIYSAALMINRSFESETLQPTILSTCVVIAGLILIEHEDMYEEFRTVENKIKDYGYLTLIPVAAAALICIIKSRGRNRKNAQKA